MPIYLLLALGAAIIYSLGSILIKRSIKEGATAGQSFHLTNLALGISFLPLLLLAREEIPWEQSWKPLLMGLTFFLGMWLTFVGLNRGDVSLVTPLMGTKVVFVALGVTLFLREMPSPALWLAAILTAIGIFVMGAGEIRKSARLRFTVAVTLVSALMFGLCDVLVSWWSEDFGGTTFLPLGFFSITLCSLVTWALQGFPSLKIPKSSRSWTAWAAVTISLQALLMAISLTWFHDATGINIVYASRGIWTLVLLSLFGAALGNSEHRDNKKAFLWRTAGTLILTAAVIIAVIALSNT